MQREIYFKISSLIASITVAVDDKNYRKIKRYLDQITRIIENETECEVNNPYIRECDIFNDDSAELIDS